MIRHSHKTSELWEKLPWKKFRQNLFRLQLRLYKAVKAKDQRKTRSIQKLILKSQAARYLAIRQVTQLNKGKKTAGIDGKKSLTIKERFALEKQLKDCYANWHHSKLREIPISKKDGTIRMLKVPTIADRAWQCLAKYAIEPAHEATFHARSYGFRPGRSTHDAQKIVFHNLRSKSHGINKRVIELDIEKCFDRISHTTIMDNLIAPQAIKIGIFRCLKAGTHPDFPEQGTPQGGVISPLLANIALNGIEECHQYKSTNSKILYPCIRYADDMVIFLRPQDSATTVLERVSEFLATRGMNASEKKTRVTASTEGFDFLGWNFKVLNDGRLKVVPSVDNYKAFRKKVKTIVNCSNYGSKTKAKKLSRIVRGWRIYHQYCDMSKSRDSLWFINHRTFKVFNKEKSNTKHSSKELVKQAFPKIPHSENSFVNVIDGKSPFDGDLVYWSERNSKLYDSHTAKALKKQNHTCGYCGCLMIPGETVHLHHVDGNHQNWKPKNCIAVHQSCHQYTHMGKREHQP